MIISLLLIINIYNTSECAFNSKIGNSINFARLFKEQADSDWSYQNLNTEFRLRLHQIDNVRGLFSTHYIVF